MQLNNLKKESNEEIKRLRRDVERGKEESRELALQAEMSRLQAEENKQQVLTLLEQLEEIKKKHDMQVYCMRGNLSFHKLIYIF